MKLEKILTVTVPMTPNFLKVGESYVPVQNFTNNELKAIGKEWTAKLISKANKRLKR